MDNESGNFEILLVEDEPGDVQLVKEALRDNGPNNNLRVARDGVEAMKFLHREGEYGNAPRPDIIFLDLNLPLKDGREVLSEIKADPDLKRIPVLVLTTSNSQKDIHRCYELHANSFFTKPMEYEKFLRLMQLIQKYWFKNAELPNAHHRSW